MLNPIKRETADYFTFFVQEIDASFTALGGKDDLHWLSQVSGSVPFKPP
jgi:hypothetical protein